jgi:hypothetical protein
VPRTGTVEAAQPVSATLQDLNALAIAWERIGEIDDAMSRGRLSRIYDLVADWLRTFILAFLTWAVIGWLLWRSINTSLSPWPLGMLTLVWIAALIFPLTGTLYIVFDLRLRLNQIRDAAEFLQLPCVYFPVSDDAESQFSRLLRLRFRESCQPVEITVFSILAGAIVLFGTVVVVWNAFYGKWPFTVMTPLDQGGRQILFSAYAGALAGGFVFILGKFRSFDIDPSTYLHASVGFISGTLGATFVGSFYPASQMTFVAFAIGFLTATNVSFLGGLLRTQTARITGVSLPPDIPGDLDAVTMSSATIELLNNMSIYSISELVKTEPLTLYLSLPESVGVINGWIDEGLLLYYFGKKNAEELAAVGVRRFTQLVELAVKQWPEAGPNNNPDALMWNTEIPSLKGSPLEQVVISQISALVETRIHHRLLGVLFERYRDSFYPTRPSRPQLQVLEATSRAA